MFIDHFNSECIEGLLGSNLKKYAYWIFKGKKVLNSYLKRTKNGLHVARR